MRVRQQEQSLITNVLSMDIYKVFVKETNLLLVKSLIILFSIISIEFLTAANQN